MVANSFGGFVGFNGGQVLPGLPMDLTAFRRQVMTDGQLLVGQTGADPLPKTVSGDGTMSAAGAFTLSSMGIIPGTYNSITLDAKGRATAASLVPAVSADEVTIHDAAGVFSLLSCPWADLTGIPAPLSGYTAANTASTVVERDASGNFSAGTITASLTGNASGSSGSCTGNAGTATALQNARTIDGVSFDGTANVVVLGTGFFGTGSDSAINLQQTDAAPAWATKSGSGATTLFTLTRDVYATTFTANNAAGNYLIQTAGFRIFASVSLTVNTGIVIHNDGGAASGTAAGSNYLSGTIGFSNVGAGSTGATNTTAASAASQAGSSACTRSTSPVAGGAKGGGTTAGTGNGSAAAGTIIYNVASGSADNFLQALTLTRQGSANLLGGNVGGNGGDATGGTTCKGGGGGGGAGILAIYTLLLVNNGTIRANGGVGAAAAIGNGTAAGGGGGGGGGVVVLMYGPGSAVGTVQVNGGGGGALAGTGGTGGTGPTGIIYQFQL